RCLSDWSSDVCSSDLDCELLARERVCQSLKDSRESTWLQASISLRQFSKFRFARRHPIKRLQVHFQTKQGSQQGPDLGLGSRMEIGRASCRDRAEIDG